MKATDFIAKFLRINNIKSVFGLQGGAVVHIFDSIIKSKIKVFFMHHEESAALAAVSNSKSTQQLGCVIVTTGPGSTNAITGLLSAWQDSVPVIFLSGQARSNHTSYGKKVRQVGTQEVNICDIVKPITKYTKFISKKENIVSEIKKATKIAISGRPGPVWLDLALEIQWSNIHVKKRDIRKISKSLNKKKTNIISQLNQAVDMINYANNPLFVFGYGMRQSGVEGKQLKNFLKKNNFPFVTTWNSADLIETSFKNNLGIIGMSGQRGANKSIFQSDLLICVGTHMAIPHTTTLYKNYAPKAKKIIINIDSNQLKNLNFKFDLKINMDAKEFINKIIKKVKKKKEIKLLGNKKLNWYEPKKTKLPNSNIFLRKISMLSKKKTAFVIDGGGTALYAGFQSSILKQNDRLLCSSSISSMGTGLAETVGAFAAKKFNTIICIIGDGSFLMNCQDLQTISHEKINTKIVIINNFGYLAIRHTQKEFLNKRYYGTLPPKDISFPNFKNLSKAFGIKYLKINNYKNLDEKIKQLLSRSGPEIIELIVDRCQENLFKQGYKTNQDGTFSPMPLEEMYPFMDSPISNTNN